QERAEGTVDVYRNIRNPLIMRSREEIARFFEAIADWMAVGPGRGGLGWGLARSPCPGRWPSSAS
ncbi:hypothetical protein ACWDAZ_34790, partial [Streptomyces sp. NPDC001215]